MIRFKLLESDASSIGLVGHAKARVTRLISELPNGVDSFSRSWNIGDIAVRVVAVLSGGDWIAKLWLSGGTYESMFSIIANTPESITLQLSGIDLSTTDDAFWTSAGITPPVPRPQPLSIVYKSGAARTFEADRTALRLAAFKRCVDNENFEHAELIGRQMDGYFEPGEGVARPSIDGVLWCDEGFFIDLDMYAGKSYLPELTDIAGDYAAPFAHNLDTPAEDTADLFTDLVNFDEYKPFNTYDNAPPHQFFKSDGSLMAEVTPEGELINGFEWLGYQSGLQNNARVSGPFAAYGFSAGDEFVVRIADVDDQSDDFSSNWKTFDRRQIGVLSVTEYSYRVVDLNPFDPLNPFLTGFRITRTNGTTSDMLFSYGPISSYSLVRANRYKYRRSPTGWVETIDETITIDEILPFTVSGNMPYSELVAPPATAHSKSLIGSYLDSSVTEYAQTPYTAAAIQYTLLSHAVTVSPTSVYIFPPRGPYATARVYPTTGTPAMSVAPSSIKLMEYVSRKNRRYYKRLDGYIVVEDADGTILMEAAPVFPVAIGAGDRAKNIQSYSYDYGFGLTEEAWRAAGTVSFSLSIPGGPTRYLLKLFMPPADGGGVLCVYRPKTDAVLYFRVTSDMTAFITARSFFIRALEAGDSAAASVHKATLLSCVQILFNSGLSTDAIAFSVNTSLATILL